MAEEIQEKTCQTCIKYQDCLWAGTTNEKEPKVCGGWTDIMEYKVKEANFPWLQKKFEKIQKVALEVGAEPPTFTVLREEFVEKFKRDRYGELELDKNGKRISDGFEKYFIITVTGKPPKLADWNFVATLTHMDTGNLIKKVPSVVENVPEVYRHSVPTCDYCQKPRARAETYLVRNTKTGEYKQIGTNCLAKFLGYSNPERVAAYATWFADFQRSLEDEEEETEKDFSRHDHYRNLLHFLAAVAEVKRRQGWISATKSRETGKPASIAEVEYQLAPYEEKNHPKYDPSPEDWKEAQTAIDFARSDSLKTDTDYKSNLKLATQKDYFHDKASGIVASLLNFKDRSIEQEILFRQKQEQWRKEKEEREAKQRQSEFVGKEGEKITLPLRLTFQKEINGDFGISYMNRLIDEFGNIFVWFSSNKILENVDQVYNLTGTVKKHEVYNEVKQTILTRCKIAVDKPAKVKKSRNTAKSSGSENTGIRGIRS